MSILQLTTFCVNILGGAPVTPPASEDMILVWDADINSTATLPLISGGSWWSYEGTTDVTVDWGDGTVESFNTPDYRTHTYSTGGEKTITISGTLTHYGDADFFYGPSDGANEGLVRVESFGNLGLVNLDSAFIYATNLTTLPSTLPPAVTVLNWMLFTSVYNGIEITNWDTSNVTRMQGIFSTVLYSSLGDYLNFVGKFNQDIGSWNTSNVTDMSWLFEGQQEFNQDIGSWDVSSVTDMTGMFYDALVFNQDIRSWDVSSALYLDRMFLGAIFFNQDLSGWCVSNIPSEPYLFATEPGWTLPKPAWGLCGETRLTTSLANDINAFFFGSSVKISNDTAIVGARVTSPSGSLYVFTEVDGNWQLQQKLVPSDGVSSSEFGESSDISGDTIVVGAKFAPAGGSQRGAAYVYTRSAGVWTEQQILTAFDGADNDRFGSVAIDGDTIVVGAFLEEETGAGRGSAYVYTRSAGVWSLEQKIVAADAADGDYFGWAVSISGDTIAIGAYLDDGPLPGEVTGTDRGSVYVYTRSAGVWTLQQKLAGTGVNETAPISNFGYSVDIDGDTIVAGSRYQSSTSSGPSQGGAAYVYTRSGGVWTVQQRLIASDYSASARFGSAVGVTGDVLIVSAPDSRSFKGTAYVFKRSAGVWTETSKIITSQSEITNRLGYSVGTDGNNVIVGSHLQNQLGEDPTEGVGAAYIYGLN